MKIRKVKRGETLEQICMEEYQDVALLPQLAKFNRIGYPERVFANFVLYIPTRRELSEWVSKQIDDGR